MEPYHLDDETEYRDADLYIRLHEAGTLPEPGRYNWETGYNLVRNWTFSLRRSYKAWKDQAQNLEKWILEERNSNENEIKEINK
jgi:hypothetical protein